MSAETERSLIASIMCLTFNFLFGMTRGHNSNTTRQVFSITTTPYRNNREIDHGVQRTRFPRRSRRSVGISTSRASGDGTNKRGLWTRTRRSRDTSTVEFPLRRRFVSAVPNCVLRESNISSRRTVRVRYGCSVAYYVNQIRLLHAASCELNMAIASRVGRALPPSDATSAYIRISNITRIKFHDNNYRQLLTNMLYPSRDT